MTSTSGAGDGGLPVWVTVLVARLAGGLVGGSVSYALVRGGGSALAAILPAAVGAVVTGVAITLILPAMSGR
ncbi:MAG: hypothetical protein ACTHNU_06070, partial [Gaiellales bacterium]